MPKLLEPRALALAAGAADAATAVVYLRVPTKEQAERGDGQVPSL